MWPSRRESEMFKISAPQPFIDLGQRWGKKVNIKKILALTLSTLLFSGCDVEFGHFAKDRQAAEAGVVEFRRLYAEGNFLGLYQLGSEEMQRNVSQKNFVDAAQSSINAFGALKTARQVAASCFPNQVRFVYLAEYEKGQATEMMAWTVHHGKASLAMYSVSPGYVEVKNNENAKCQS